MEDLKKLEVELQLRGFSQKTIREYIYHNRNFLEYIGKSSHKICEDDIKSYLAYLMSSKKYSAPSLSLVRSSLKFFYQEILKKPIFEGIKTPKIARKLPTVLTKGEVRALFDAAKSPKHRLLMEFLYSSGLRVSECVSLRVEDIEFSEKIGWVREGKGRKDRMIIISESLLAHLKDYLEGQNICSGYIFAGKGGHITTRAAQKVVSDAAKRAKISKRVYCHALRSTFATHLLESGIDIRKIQTLLGHSNLQTTQIYTQVSSREIKKIRSPLDDL